MTDRTLPNLLDEIEKREMPLLSWGVVGGSFTDEELLTLLEDLRPDEDPEDLLDALLEHQFVVARGTSGDRFRSRMAETVRLAVGLRQWLPSNTWRTAAPLVSDVRFLSRPRVVPRRDRTPDELIASSNRAVGDRWTSAHDTTMRAIVGARMVSSFQERSAARLLSAVSVEGASGTCVTAGTGAGKTLAFYLPALTHIMATPRSPGVPRIVAIYPRIELLRDQLRSLLSTLAHLEGDGLGPVGVGVLYGATPQDRADASGKGSRGWAEQSDGLVCPILTCLQPDCAGAYVWPTKVGEAEVLRCESCGHQLTTLSFTRSALQSKPPEVLFTTTEMVNRQLGSSRMRRALIGTENASPDFVLLDEIHTYSGTHGAQVSNLIRRWRSEMARPSHFVGLSATLADPVGFFSQLVGLGTNSVSVVAPAEAELVEFGREYFMALRGDPASQKSLLSTTIQTSMLLRRMLDREPGQPSGGAFGSLLFVFTDKLDLVNRLHTQLRDAEGWLPGGVNRKPTGSLAVLRATGDEDWARDQAGQLWDVAESLGTLNRHVVVSRTTSKDSGVEAGTDVVVATASLEVGFDDPNVGAVLQHKAPRDAAQFLQRRGRAGRDPSMRPWTAVVLSDYGRDRLSFQAYERLFDPVVQPNHLPVHNRVILKMQATWWLLDYISSRFTSGRPLGNVMTRPWSRSADLQRDLAQSALDGIRGLTTDAGVQRLAFNLRRVLDIDDETTRAVLWDHPRAIMTSVVPTLIRRLEAVVDAGGIPNGFSWDDPMSDFVPGSLFAPLQTPEIQLVLPSTPRRDEVTETEAVSLSLREFAPGRVSYRFALGGKRDRMWVAPPDSSNPTIPVEDFADDTLEVETPPESGLQRLVQPRRMKLATPMVAVPDSAYGKWCWQSAFRVEGSPLALDVPATSSWRPVVTSIEATIHRARCPVTVWRFANECEVERRMSSEPPLTRHRVTMDDENSGIGFAMEVDGVRLRVALPSDLTFVDSVPGLESALRVSYLEHLVDTAPRIVRAAPSPFLRSWLAQLLLSALVVRAEDSSLTDVLDSLDDSALRDDIVAAARDVFGAGPDDDHRDDPSDPGLVSDIEAAVGLPDVLSALRDAGSRLSGPLSPSMLPWLRERYLVTVAAAFIDALQAICPDLDIDELRPDIETEESDPAEGTIWITEDQPGGTGLIETAVDRYLEDPRAFWALVSSALGRCAGERVDAALRAYLRTREGGELASGDAVRSATTLQSLTEAWSAHREDLFEHGIDCDQSVVSALSTRLLRPGSDPRIEAFVHRLLADWDELEGRLGVEVDLRVFAHTVARRDDVRRELVSLSGASPDGVGSPIGQIIGLLWTRGGRLRASSLQNYNPYRDLPPTERLLLADVVAATRREVDATQEDWRTQLDQALRDVGEATVMCTAIGGTPASVIRSCLTTPTAVGVLEFHPRVVGLRRSSAELRLDVELREAHQ